MSALYFNSINDIILDNWWKVRDGLHEFCSFNVNVENTVDDEKAYERINDSFLQEVGVGREEEYLQEIRMQLALIQCDYVIDNNEYLRNKIRHLENEIEEILKKPSLMSREQVLIHMEKWMGFRLNEKEITAKKFYDILGELEREISAQQNS